MTLLMVLVGIAVLLVLATVAAVAGLVHICAPNEVLIFAGGQRTSGARTVGYRLVQGGRGVRVPMLERVYRMDLTNMIIEIKVSNAYARGGIPLDVEGVANLKIASTEPSIGNAIERFLGYPRAEIIRVARETLEGNLRGVLATLTPEEVNNDRVKFAEALLHEADEDLDRLGLELDTLKIQSVSDDRGYLDSLGRKQTAELLMRSRVAEAENQALGAERSAENQQVQHLARVAAEISKVGAEADRRVLEARTRGVALIAEERAAVAAQVAGATGELAVQTARIEMVRLRLEADRVRPAAARRDEMIEAARAAAAPIVEDGKAAATALDHLGATWAQAGDAARQILVAQKLVPLVGTLMDTVTGLKIDRLTVIDGSIGAGAGDVARKAALMTEQIRQTTGVDVPALLRGLASR